MKGKNWKRNRKNGHAVNQAMSMLANIGDQLQDVSRDTIKSTLQLAKVKLEGFLSNLRISNDSLQIGNKS